MVCNGTHNSHIVPFEFQVILAASETTCLAIGRSHLRVIGEPLVIFFTIGDPSGKNARQWQQLNERANESA